MTDISPQEAHRPVPPGALALAVGCEFHLETQHSVAAVVQVAP